MSIIRLFQFTSTELKEIAVYLVKGLLVCLLALAISVVYSFFDNKEPIHDITSALPDGEKEFRLCNPNEFEVVVRLRRDDGAGRTFTVGRNSTTSAKVPRGEYDVYFNYSSESTNVYRGDKVRIYEEAGIQITISKVADGNYHIEKVQ